MACKSAARGVGSPSVHAGYQPGRVDQSSPRAAGAPLRARGLTDRLQAARRRLGMHRRRDMARRAYGERARDASSGLVNRNNATIAVAQGLLIDLQPQHLTSCCALKSARNPHEMGFVAVLRFKTGIGRRACLRCRGWELMGSAPQTDQTEACGEQHRRKSGKSAILRSGQPWHSGVALPAKHGKDFWTAGGSESTRLGSPPKSRIRTGLPRRHICGARRMAHG